MSRLLLGLMWLIHLLPLRLQAAIGNAIGGAMFWLVRSRRRVTRINLAKCFPGMDAAAYINESIHDPQAYVVSGYPPVMPSFRGTLTEEEISQVVAYLLTKK